MSLLEPAMSNIFPSQSKPLLLLVIIDSEFKYKIFQIIDLKVDHRHVYKLLYKVICLEYKNTEEKSNWPSIFKLIHTSNIISDFY